MAEFDDTDGKDRLFKVNPDTDGQAGEVLEGKTAEEVLFGAVDGAKNTEASEILDEEVESKNEIVIAGENVEEPDRVLDPAKVWVVDENGRYRNILFSEIKQGQSVEFFVVGDRIPNEGDMKPGFARDNKEDVLNEENKSDFVNVRGDLKKLSNNRNKQNISEEIIERMTRENGLNFSGIPGVDYFGSDGRMRAIAENGRLQIGWAVNMIDNNGKSVEDGKKTGRFENVIEAKRFLRKIGVKFEGDSEVDQNVPRNENGQQQPAEPVLGETEDSKKARLMREAHDFLSNLIATRSGVDSVDEIAFRNWVTNHGKYADQVDLTRANALLGEIATRRENQKRREEEMDREREEGREKNRQERLDDRERRAEDRAREQDRIRKAEREKREEIERRRVLDRLERKKFEDARLEISKIKDDMNIRFNEISRELNAKPKLVPSSKQKKLWFEKVASFIADYDKDEFGHIPEVAERVERARALEKEEKAKELTFGDKMGGFLGDLFNPGNLINKLTGGRLYKRRPYIKK